MDETLKLYLDEKFSNLDTKQSAINEKLGDHETRINDLETEKDQRDGAESVKKAQRETGIGFLGVMVGGVLEFIANWFSGGHFHQ